ncbi:unnamed protein product [[Candida] boidinii]|uniref:Unnamed protein product n=1 Tax=Candida boidinii TaxID=5477 RepID=A0ACB5TMC3_CANBO|nr:unnamed protein product [[Candida] boidinii]
MNPRFGNEDNGATRRNESNDPDTMNCMNNNAIDRTPNSKLNRYRYGNVSVVMSPQNVFETPRSLEGINAKAYLERNGTNITVASELKNGNNLINNNTIEPDHYSPHFSAPDTRRKVGNILNLDKFKDAELLDSRAFPKDFNPRKTSDMSYKEKVNKWILGTISHSTTEETEDECFSCKTPTADLDDYSDINDIVEYQSRLITHFVRKLYFSSQGELPIYGDDYQQIAFNRDDFDDEKFEYNYYSMDQDPNALFSPEF